LPPATVTIIEMLVQNVLVVGKFDRDNFALHVAEGLTTLGYRVLRFELGHRGNTTASMLLKRVDQAKNAIAEALRAVPVLRERETAALLRYVGRENVSLTIVCHDYLQPAQVAQLKERTGTPVCIWFPDSISRLGRAYFLNAPYDCVFVKDPYLVVMLRKELGDRVPVYYLPECCSPARHVGQHEERDGSQYRCEVTTAGNLYPTRVALFEQLQEFDVKIWGNPPAMWMDVSGIRRMLHSRYVTYEEKALVFSSAKIVLNNLSPSEIWGVNARTFEIAAAGGFQLISERPALPQLFDDGREIVTYSDLGDLKEKLRYYLLHDSERERIAHAGRARAC
jgi:spore maturation protein CgeB